MRIKYLVKHKLQFTYLAILLIGILLPLMLVPLAVYYLIFTVLAHRIAIPDWIAYNLFPAIGTINKVIIIAFPFLILLVIFWSLVLSHRIVGPIYRLEKDLDDIVDGKRRGPIKIRKADELKEVVEKINRLIDSLEKHRCGKA